MNRDPLIANQRDSGTRSDSEIMLERWNDMMASQVHPTTTLNQIPRIPTEPPPSATPPKNPSTMARPQSSDRRASAGAWRRDIARAATKQLTARDTNPRVPATKWTNPAVLIVVGGPGGVPTGNPSIGSAGKTAAMSMPTPKVPRNQLTLREVVRRTRRNPTAAATTMSPHTTKLAVWTQAPGPF